MSRLIEEDVAVERISNAIWILPNEAYPRFNNFDTFHAVVKDAVNALPTIEPRKGKWIGKYPVTSACSECNYLIHDSKVKAFAFCPNCGADMREESE